MVVALLAQEPDGALVELARPLGTAVTLVELAEVDESRSPIHGCSPRCSKVASASWKVSSADAKLPCHVRTCAFL